MGNKIIKTYTAAVDIPAHRLVKFSADNTVTLATSGTDDIIGVSDDVDVKAGNPVDVVLQGVCEVQFAGTLTYGKPFTAGTDGKATALDAEAETPENKAGITLKSVTADEIALAVIK